MQIPCRRKQFRHKVVADTAAAEELHSSGTYDRSFWLAYISNLLTGIVVALLYRYADFVTLTGGNELHLGWIVGVGTVGSLTVRLALGVLLDRHSAKMIWIASMLLLSATCFAHLSISSCTGISVYLLRILFCCAVAGFNGASITFVAKRAPDERMAELVGMLGTAGFIGVMIGSLLSDIIVNSTSSLHQEVVLMFVSAGITSLLVTPILFFGLKDKPSPKSKASASLFEVLRKHVSGMILLVGFAMGFGLTLPATFLQPYAAEIDIARIGVFFTTYSASAIITRIISRRWNERFGPRPIIFLGLSVLVASVCLFLTVRVEWQLIFPAIGYGFSHALLFPAAVASMGMAFPPENRGLANVLILAAWDFGQFVGAPFVGVVLHSSRLIELPPYQTMFLTVATMLAVINVFYMTGTRRTIKKVG